MDTPSYLPLLNSIAVNECKGEQLLSAWADCTRDEQLASILRFVAIREGEHAWAFTKRMCELGHAVCEDTAYQVFKDFDGLLACVRSDSATQRKSRGFATARGSAQKPERDPHVRDVYRLFQRHHHRSDHRRTARPLHRRGARQRTTARCGIRRICGSRGTSSERQEIEALKSCVAELRLGARQPETRAFRRVDPEWPPAKKPRPSGATTSSAPPAP